MIVGVGIDLCPISRMRRALERHGGRFEERVFTEAERAYCRARGEPAQHFAARFAAKEALLKALGVPGGLSWHELEVVSTEDGAPGLRLWGEARRVAERLGADRLHLSLSHGGDTAAAVVIAERRAP
ncbi:MAG: holo-ACP synthase [Myxococcales bacterium]|nr:holo-ACP synthase [Myxococcota bacterium]MDW8281145.1 holo-ACP synthase [Myxococcales bacterium]